MVILLAFLVTTSCARKVEVKAPELIKEQRYSYIRDVDGRVYVVAVTSKDFDEAIKKIDPGPASAGRSAVRRSRRALGLRPRHR